MKQRFSSLDVKVIAKELSYSLCTLRLANVYDLSSRIFLLKFAKPDQRQSLVIDSGFRCHLSAFTRATASTPSAFVSRLRKFLKTRRVTSVSQVGTDRIIEFQFSEGQYRLFLEFYAGGNIVLTDKELSIITLLRIVPEGPEQEELRIGLRYSLDNRQNYKGVPALSEQRIRASLEKALAKGKEETAVQQKKSSKKQGDALRKALATSLNEFPPMLIDHALQVTGFNSSTPVEEVLKQEVVLEKLMLALKQAQIVIDHIMNSERSKGYIIAKAAKSSSSEKEIQKQDRVDPARHLMYEDFHPFKPNQFEDNPENTILEFDGFNNTVDEFFSSIESQKLDSRLTEREEHAKKKLETARRDHEKRLGGLQQVQELSVRKAQAIEANLQRVEEAIVAINGLIAQGTDWQNVARLIEMEQARHNVVAEMIKLPLKLYENTATLLLVEADYEDEDDFEGDETGSDVSDSEDESTNQPKSTNVKPADRRLAVDVNLALSPWSNARQYFDQKKSAGVKERKTIQSSEKALKSTEKKITADLKKGLKQEKEVMRPQRKANWFEKFVYFISSEGYLVLGGKDTQQNEILYKKYLSKGDIYIHADLLGAASFIVKNKRGKSGDPIPPSTLSQAGTLAVATSSAWDSKAVMSAWWVSADQVSKTAPTGEYLQTGGFTIRGHKHFLPPAQLLLGFGIMFRVSEESKARHLKNRFREASPSTTLIPAKPDEDGGKEEWGDLGDAKDEDLETGGSMKDTDPPIGDEEGNDELGADKVNDGSDEGGDGVSEDLSDSESRPDNPLRPDNRERNDMEEQKDQDVVDSDPRYASASETDEEEIKARDSIAEQETGKTDSQSKAVCHPSAKEHRLVRKDPAEDTDNVESEDKTSPFTEIKPSKTSTQPKAQIQPAPPRGKRGKGNKLKTKYANQDEEDRTLAMRLLGSAAAQEKATDDAAAKVAKGQELALQKERRRKQNALIAENGKEAEGIRRLNFEEGTDADALEGEELEGLDDLDAFIGAPVPGDEILDTLVVCGPWDAIGSRCRWRVKLQPGATKKGKAVREILGKWTSTIMDREKKKRPGSGEGNETMIEEEQVRKREGELIRAIRETEVIGVVPVGKVRVVMGAGDGGGRGRGGGGAGKGKRGGKGSKKQR